MNFKAHKHDFIGIENGQKKFGWCLCPVANFTRHVEVQTFVQSKIRIRILTCSVKLVTEKKSFPNVFGQIRMVKLTETK